MQCVLNKLAELPFNGGLAFLIGGMEGIKMKKSILVFAMITFFSVTTLFFMGLSNVSGKPDKPNPNEAMMNILEDIYDIVWETNLKVEGILIQKTGQSLCWDSDGNPIDCEGTGQDGESTRGAAWPDPRFTKNFDGTVTDHLTGLIWLKDANCFGAKEWASALSDANGLASGSCGLTDGSIAGDWHLPNVRELHSLIDYGKTHPALPSGHPFTGVQSPYWSSTTDVNATHSAWYVDLPKGYVNFNGKDGYFHVWPVRSDN